MNKLKIALLSLLLVTVAGVIFFVSQQTAQQKNITLENETMPRSLEPAVKPVLSNTKEETRVAVVVSDDQTVEQALNDADAMIKETEKELIEDDNEEQELAELMSNETEAILVTDLWEINEKSREALIEAFKLPQNLKRVQGVTMKLNELDRILVGDKIELPNINGNSYAATVNHVKSLKSGDLSVQASISAYGTDYPLRITRGKTITFANITTPRGNFQLQIKPNGEGIIIPENELDKLIDTSKPDTIIPPTYEKINNAF
ncbi:MAG: hypothetical protein ACWA5U_09660 [bacterium]